MRFTGGIMRSGIGVFVCILFTCLFVFVSCSESRVEQLVDLLVSVALDDSRSMTLGSEAPSRDSITWTYKLTKMDSGMNLGEGDEALLEGSVKVSPGRWQIEVWGYRDSECREVVYVGKGEGDVGVGGSTLRVVASTTTDPLSANSLDPSKEPKDTAELILGNLKTEKDVQLDLATYVYWKVDGKVIAQWAVRAGEDTMGNLQGHLYTKDGELITDETEIVVEVPAGVHDIQVYLQDVEGGVLSSLFWENKELEMNCVHRFNGTMPVKYLDYVYIFDVIPSWDLVPKDHMVVGFAYNLYEDEPKLEKYPLPVYVEEIKEIYTCEELNLRSYSINPLNERGGNGEVWLNINAKIPYPYSSIYKVRFNPSSIYINRNQTWNCTTLEEVVIHEGIRGIRDSGIGAGIEEIVLPASLDYLEKSALRTSTLTRLVFKNPEGWFIDGEAVSSETLSNPEAAADFYKENMYSNWYRVQEERECTVVLKLGDLNRYIPWEESDIESPLDGYTCYESKLEGTRNIYSSNIKIVFLNDGDHTIYMRYESQDSQESIFASSLNYSSIPGAVTSATKYVCATPSYGTSLDSYCSFTYEGVKAGDYCYITIRKNSNEGDCVKGYVLAPDKVEIV